ncbi:MAG: rhomboid family protein [Limisphaerales bacterium]|nr:MAG: rhomboid family protein [Limisphaerales bacterium]KAG0507213.1 MAG: rhomboid family protein [Limisphaerales bacterium]TXT47465.1 MAG: rhomboid family protein [Limisphaerales bacterium]
MRNAAAASRRHRFAWLLALAVLATFSPGFHVGFVLDREALAAGEVWRLWTGHLAHFSLSHLLADTAVFALLAVALRRAGECSLGRVLFLGAVVLSGSLLLCDVWLSRFGGLSGLNALLLGRLAVRWFQAGGRLRVLGLVLLAIAAGKFTLDSVGLGGTGVEFGSITVVPSHLSHWLGLFWGLVLPVTTQAKKTFSAVRRSIQSRSRAERKSRRSRMSATESA